jgi:probable HAF family extracellular repeat protein
VGTGGAVTMVDLGTLGGSASWGNAINSTGQVTGYSVTSGGGEDAFLASVGTGGAVTMIDLGSLGGGSSWGTGINNAGQVTGYAWTSSLWSHAFLASVGTGGAVTMTDLGTLGDPASFGTSINASGNVLGYDQTSFGTTADYFLYDPAYDNTTYSNHLLDLTSLLTSSGWSNVTVSALNDNNQLTGYGVIGGQENAFLLDLSAVPESPTYMAWSVGLIMVLFLGDRFRRGIERNAGKPLLADA